MAKAQVAKAQVAKAQVAKAQVAKAQVAKAQVTTARVAKAKAAFFISAHGKTPIKKHQASKQQSGGSLTALYMRRQESCHLKDEGQRHYLEDPTTTWRIEDAQLSMPPRKKRR